MGGDGVRLVMTIKKVDFALAATMIETVIGKGPYAHDASAAKDTGEAKDPMRSWTAAGPFLRNSAVDIYLKRRAIDLTNEEALSLRFAPSLFHWITKTKWPAMLAQVMLATGEAITTHQTFVEPDGSDKAEIEKPRLFVAGGKTTGGGVWFGKADPAHEFIIAEGIESALSAMRIYGVTAGCAALSDSGIRALILPPEAQRVRIFADNDELHQSLSAAREAKRRWKAEGRTVAVCMSPIVGWDANDVLKKKMGL